MIVYNKDEGQAIQALNTSKGQIVEIIKMMEEGRYCIDISNQIITAQTLLMNYTGDEKVD